MMLIGVCSAGFKTTQLPAASAGESFQTGGVEYRIERVDNRRVDRVRLTVLATQPSDH